jgi:hypothetical protein
MPQGELGILAEAQRETVRAIMELSQATAANTQALSGLTREIGGLPGLLAGLAGGVRGGGSVLGSIFKSALGLVPLGLQIAGLFRDRKENPVPPAPFALPPSLALEVANTEAIPAGLPRVERGEGDRPRAVEPERLLVVQQPQVTVNVSAMDSRSFVDHSADIARAVREAMLHMHPVNDLISEL